MIDKQTNTRLKHFAQDARRYLIDQVNTKLREVLASDSDASTYEKTKPLYNALLKEVSNGRSQFTGELKLETCNLKPIAERVAYTWFNRLTALRYMDLKHFSPTGIISPLSGDTLPQILAEAKMGVIDSSLISQGDRNRVLGLLSGTVDSTFHKGDAQSEAYRILLLSACNHFGKILPFLFKPIKDWMELLLPDDLLSEHSILAMIREVMTMDSCQDVEVIGWLYQYYISEKKEEVFANVKKGRKVQSQEIPAVTQLFTPHWIVKYMVQNSLGRLWLAKNPKSTLKDKMEYYVQADAVPPTDNINSLQKGASASACTPEEIKFCDPCCGSGHILTYAFDLLYEIYSEEGYDPIDIPGLIITRNLYGIEIDERAAELAAFALSMKAREKDRQWFLRGIDPMICCLKNIRFSKDEIEPYLDKCGRDIFTYNFERMLSQFEDADTYGSLIVPYEQDIEGIRELLNTNDFNGDVFLAPTHNKVLKIIEQADYLSTKYQVVVTNPPYMSKGMSDKLSRFLQENYKDVKSDLFSAFVFRCAELAVDNAYIGIMSPNVWMYLSSYEKLRMWMINNKTLTNLVELPLSGFTGATVQICAYNFINHPNKNQFASFVRLVGFKGADEEMAVLTKKAIANPDCSWFFRCRTSDFNKIPGTPIAYWVSNAIYRIYSKCKFVSDIAIVATGMTTGDNERFTRLWHEVNANKMGLRITSEHEAVVLKKKWIPYNKGGSFRKWYGNNEFVVNWEFRGKEIIESGRSYPRAKQYYFKDSITWTFVSSSNFGVRNSDQGFIFDMAGCSAFTSDLVSKQMLLAFLCSGLAFHILKMLNPTLNFQAGNIGSLPWVSIDSDVKVQTVLRNVEVLKGFHQNDWDSYETSWDFQQLPLLQVSVVRSSLKDAYEKLREQWIEMTLRMQELEEENNRIFIAAYGLEDELTPDVPLKEITLTCNPYYRYGVSEGLGEEEDVAYSEASIRSSTTLNQALTIKARLTLDEGIMDGTRQARKKFPLRKDLEDRLLADTMKELISYAVGCMFGRYSLDKPGLILANQGEGLEDYLKKVTGEEVTESATCRWIPDADNVIPILDGEWFIDDIAARFKEFLKVSFGAEKFSENLSFLEEAIGKPIRTYFLKDFYTDHLKRYKKRPIYWLFSSPKGSFNALIYMHRYNSDTVSIILNGYLREYIHKLRAKSLQLEHQLNTVALSEREKMLTRREIEHLEEVIMELEEWERKVILPLAEKRIEIDLDDGVKVNYLKFSGAVRNIPGLEAKEEKG